MGTDSDVGGRGRDPVWWTEALREGRQTERTETWGGVAVGRPTDTARGRWRQRKVSVEGREPWGL